MAHLEYQIIRSYDERSFSSGISFISSPNFKKLLLLGRKWRMLKICTMKSFASENFHVRIIYLRLLDGCA